MSHNPGYGAGGKVVRAWTPQTTSVKPLNTGSNGSMTFLGTGAGGRIVYPQPPFAVPDQRSEVTSVETETENDRLKLQVVQLEKRMTGLEAVVNDQEITIKNLCEIIDEFRRNFSGQRGHQKPSYWEER